MSEVKKGLEIILQNVRLSYVYAFKKYVNEDGKEGTYCAHAIFAPDHPQIAALKELQRKAAIDEYGVDAEAILTQLSAQDRLLLHRGDVSKPGKDGYAGKLFVSCNSNVRPTVVDENRRPLTAADDKIYSGAWANVMINVWAQNNKWGKRVNAGLMGIQFVKHDERLGGGGRVASAEEFGVVATDADGAAPASGGDGLI